MDVCKCLSNIQWWQKLVNSELWWFVRSRRFISAHKCSKGYHQVSYQRVFQVLWIWGNEILCFILDLLSKVSYERNPNVLQMPSYARIRLSRTTNRLSITIKCIWVLNAFIGLKSVSSASPLSGICFRLRAWRCSALSSPCCTFSVAICSCAPNLPLLNRTVSTCDANSRKVMPYPVWP